MMGSNPSKQSNLEVDLKVCPIGQLLPTGAGRLGQAMQCRGGLRCSGRLGRERALQLTFLTLKRRNTIWPRTCCCYFITFILVTSVIVVTTGQLLWQTALQYLNKWEDFLKGRWELC